MKTQLTLPENYKQRCVIDLEKDKKTFYLVNGLSLLIAVAVFVLGAFLIPIDLTIDTENIVTEHLLPVLTMIAGVIAYIFLHEGVHGVFIALFSRRKPKFGARLPFYFYAGSEAYFPKAQYLVIALAPVVFWGVVLAAIIPFLSNYWAWAVYIIELVNLSGAAGDIFVTFKLLKMPKDVLVQDTGVSMTVFEKARTTEDTNTEENV